jgi:hypothetical protein
VPSAGFHVGSVSGPVAALDLMVLRRRLANPLFMIHLGGRRSAAPRRTGGVTPPGRPVLGGSRPFEIHWRSPSGFPLQSPDALPRDV